MKKDRVDLYVPHLVFSVSSSNSALLLRRRIFMQISLYYTFPLEGSRGVNIVLKESDLKYLLGYIHGYCFVSGLHLHSLTPTQPTMSHYELYCHLFFGAVC